MDEKTYDPAYSNWSKKEDMWHCEPPVSILESMAFAYIALDQAQVESGGLEIGENTHNAGKIPASDIIHVITDATIATPALDAGEVLLIQALTLHRSASLKGSNRRRALRLDFCRHPVTV